MTIAQTQKGVAMRKQALTVPETHLWSGAKGDLDGVIDHLAKVRRLQDPKDTIVDLRSLKITFDNGKGGPGPMLISRGNGAIRVSTTAASQLAKFILPSKFWSGFKKLATLDPRLAGQVWETFAKNSSTKNKRRMLRFARRKVGTLPYQVLRAAVSTQYARIGDADLCEAVKKVAPEHELTVARWDLWTGDFSVRFVATDPMQKGMADLMGTTMCLPSVSMSNSEVGRRSVTFRGGVFRPALQCGLPAWSNKSKFWRAHRGNAAAIMRDVKGVWSDLLAAASEVETAYNEACAIDVDGDKVLRDWGKKQGLSQTIIDCAVKALKSDRMVAPEGTLGRAVDALAIQGVGLSLDQREAVEESASGLLLRGVNGRLDD